MSDASIALPEGGLSHRGAAAVRARSEFAAAQPDVAVALIGTGQVGGALLRRFALMRDPPRPVFVANSRSAVHAAASMGWRELGGRLAESRERTDLDRVTSSLCASRADRRIVIDATAAPEVSARHRDWLSRGISVVSANKLALAGTQDEWFALRSTQRASGAAYGDSATVGAGLPALATLRRLVQAGDRPRSLEGVLSGSLSYLLNHYDGTLPFSALLARARELGYLEPDPRADLSGEDVARKLLILARTAGFELESHDIDVEPLFPAEFGRLSRESFERRLPELDAWLEAQREAAAGNGRVLRYVARLDGRGRAEVRLKALLPAHPCALLQGSDNLFVFQTERYRDRPLVIQGPGAGPEVTAQALLADVLEIAR